MATKKNTAKSRFRDGAPPPKTIKYRGITLTRNDSGDYTSGYNFPYIYTYPHSNSDLWEAEVQVGSGCRGGLCYEKSYSSAISISPQKAIDLALDDALEALSDHILELTKDKKALLNIKKGK